MSQTILDDKKEISIYKLAETLDEEQVEAVMTEPNNTLVKANAGAGKTRVLTARVAYLMATGTPAENILLVTFTKKASKEMVDRVQTMLGGRKVNILGGTFHGLGVIFLRRYADKLGYKKNFTILDTDDAKSLIEEIRKTYLKENGLKKSEFPDKKVLYHYYSSSINKDMSYDYLNAEENRFPSSILMGIDEILATYIARKKEANLMDFDDLIVNFKEILLDRDIRKEITNQYRHVLVDEYQDINHIQNSIIESLNMGNQHLFAVGDINQAIYRWRGSNVSFIENFERNHYSTNHHYITHNYRSDADILRLAEYSINHNYKGSERTVITPFHPSKNKPIVYEATDDYQQADFIISEIKKRVKEGLPYSEIAILMRTNFLTRIVEKALRQSGIPYKLLAGFSFFERKHIKDIMAFLRFMENPKDEIAFLRMALMFEGVGEKTVGKLFIHYKNANYDVNAFDSVKIGKGALSGVTILKRVLKQLLSKPQRIEEMIAIVMEEYYDSYLKRTEDNYSDRMKDLEYLVDTAKSYTSLSDFLSEMILEDVKEEQSDNAVTITTVHKSKGLEWDCVFIPYVNEGVFPSLRSSDPEGIKEERRLFYVAITRARKHLAISSIKWQTFTDKSMAPSPFLLELLPSLYKKVK